MRERLWIQRKEDANKSPLSEDWGLKEKLMAVMVFAMLLNACLQLI
jgi:hypothetical protein